MTSYDFIFGKGRFYLKDLLAMIFVPLFGFIWLPVAIFLILTNIDDPWAGDHVAGGWSIILFVLFIVLYAYQLNVYRSDLRNGVFSAIVVPPLGKGQINIEDLFPLNEENDEEKLDLVSLLLVAVNKIVKESNLKRLLNNYLPMFCLGLYLIYEHPDISSGYFLIGSEIILFVMIFLPFHLFSKKPIELLHENPRWPQYQDLLKNYIATNKNEGE